MKFKISKIYVVHRVAVLALLMGIAQPIQASFFSIGTENIKLKGLGQTDEREFVADTFSAGLDLKVMRNSRLIYEHRVERDKQARTNQSVVQKLSIANAYSKNQEWSFSAGIARYEITEDASDNNKKREFIGMFGSVGLGKSIVSDNLFVNLSGTYEAFESRTGEGKFDVSTYVSALALRVDSPYIGLLIKVGYQYKKTTSWLDSKANVKDGLIASVAFHF